jgi:hypothetical protein
MPRVDLLIYIISHLLRQVVVFFINKGQGIGEVIAAEVFAHQNQVNSCLIEAMAIVVLFEVPFPVLSGDGRTVRVSILWMDAVLGEGAEV